MSEPFVAASANAFLPSKTRRNDRVTKVDRRMVIASKRKFAKALQSSKDSETLYTSFIERLDLVSRTT